MTNSEIIAVVQAHAEGKKIDVKPKGGDSGYRYDWLPLIQPKWNFEKCDYRVAPEPRKPREWWIGVWVNSAKSVENGPLQAVGLEELVHVREVIE